MRRRQWLMIGAAGGAGLAAWAGRWIWEANRAAGEAAVAVAGERWLPFARRLVSPVAEAGILRMPSPANFRDVAAYGGQVWVLGSESLQVYSGAGEAQRAWRCGFELPAAPLQAMAVGGVGAGDGAGESEAKGLQLWVATGGAGVLQLDGEKVWQILPRERGQAKVACLLPLASGAMLLGTEAGLLRFDGNTMVWHHPELAGVNVIALAGSEQELWLGTANQGAWRLRAGQLDRLGRAEGVPDGRVEALAQAEEEGVVVGTPVGAVLVRGERVERPLFTGSHVLSLACGEGGCVAGTLQDGLRRMALTARGGGAVAASGGELGVAQGGELGETQMGRSPVRRLRRLGGEGGRGELLVVEPTRVWRCAASGKGWGAPALLLQAEASQLSDGNIAALHAGPDGRLWIGYFDQGLDVLSASGVRTLRDEVLFCVNRIAGPAELGGGMGGGLMAVATANGLAWVDGALTRRRTLTRQEGLLASHATDVLLLPGQVVVATPAGLNLMDAAGMQGLYAFHGLVNNHVYALAWHQEQIFAGTLGGITRLQAGQVRESYTTANSGLQANWVTALQASGGRLLAGTYGGGVAEFTREGQWQAVSGVPRNVVVNPGAMVALPEGRGFAVGTLSEGLWLQGEGGGWRNLREGLPSLNVTALAFASKSLYVGTDNGLVRMEERIWG